MTSQAEALAWIDQQVGKSLDFDGYYGSQCVDLVAYYCQKLGVSPYRGNARTWWETGYNGGGAFQRVTGQPQAGDIAVFKPNKANGQAGHIALVREAYNGSFKSLDQNWFNSNSVKGSPAAWVTHINNSDVYGFLRPNFNGGAGMAYISDAELADFKKWKAQGMELQKFQNETLYPYVETISKALGIPADPKDLGLPQTAIQQLRDKSTSSVTRESVIEYVTKNLK